jgi:pimeloyl-ACP methyl ester carboxylesterase
VTKLSRKCGPAACPPVLHALGEQYQAPRSWAEQAYPNLIYFNEVDRGGHFAAWEQPQLFCEEIRAAFKSLR